MSTFTPPATVGARAPARIDAPYHPLRGLAMATTVLLALVGLAQAGAAFAFYNRAGVLTRMIEGRRVTQAAADAADSAVMGTAIVSLVLAVATAVVFTVWSFQFVANVRALGREPAPGPGWTIGGWFVPLAQFVIPARTLLRADAQSDAVKGAGGNRSPEKSSQELVIIGWAVCIAAYAVTERLSARAARQWFWPPSLRTADRFSLLGSVLLVLAAGLAILMVRRLTDRQGQAHMWRTMPAPPPSSGELAPMPPSMGTSGAMSADVPPPAPAPAPAPITHMRGNIPIPTYGARPRVAENPPRTSVNNPEE